MDHLRRTWGDSIPGEREGCERSGPKEGQEGVCMEEGKVQCHPEEGSRWVPGGDSDPLSGDTEATKPASVFHQGSRQMSKLTT